MKLKMERDLSLDACTITHESIRLETSEDVAEWRATLMAEADKVIGSERVYLLIDYRGFSVSPAVAEEYGRVAEELRRRFAKQVFRYNAVDPLSSAAARLQSMKRAHSSNVFATRQEAIEALRRHAAENKA